MDISKQGDMLFGLCTNYSIFIFPPGDGGAESYLNNIVPYLKERKLILFNNILIHIFNLNYSVGVRK